MPILRYRDMGPGAIQKTQIAREVLSASWFQGGGLGYERAMKFMTPVWFAFAIAMSACTAAQQHDANDSAQQLASSAPDAAKNAYLTAAVSTKLATVDINSATSVKVQTNAGVVTLTGAAQTEAKRAAFVSAAKSIDGVVSVRDSLTIDPHLRGVRQQTDDVTLAASVTTAIAAQAGVNVFHVSTSAHDGTVTLDGTVPSRSVARTVVETARGISGVKVVVDKLRVAR
jgi:osmotically-inducible protein OsmY